ncbi:MAG TPA: ABC transporter permease [Coleofasciculaceae cyanobacterium]
MSIRDSLTSIKDSLTSIKDSLTSIKDSLTSIRDSLTSIRDSLTSIRDSLISIKDSLISIKTSSRAESKSIPSTSCLLPPASCLLPFLISKATTLTQSYFPFPTNMSLSPLDLLALTLNSLRGNPLRSALTTLGVFMGVASVSATLQVGSISRAVIEKELAQRDAPQVGVSLWQVRDREPKLEDMQFLQQRLPELQAISASNYVWEIPSQTVFQDREAEPEIQAVSPDFFRTSGKRVLVGRSFTTADFANYRSVAVIDQFLSQQLFQSQDPIGQIIFTGQNPFLVIGVMETKLRGEGDEPKGELLMPMSTYSSLTGNQGIKFISMRPHHLKDMKQVEERAKQLLEQRFPGADLYAWNNVEDILQQQETLELASRGLTAVGIISLLIGGVGIANITIAAVMERTPEIGLRRAIGATKRDILLQFVLEAALLSLFGGISAIITVHGLTVVVANTFNLPYEFERNIAVLSLSSALLVGVGAGFLPALRASQIDPVDALRSM